jgi:hypothetical protein
VTSTASTITVTIATSGIDATQWRWSLTRRQTFGCDNTYGDGVLQSVGSLASTITINGTTEGCRYLIKVAGFNGVIGEYAEYDELAGGAANGLNIFVKTESGVSTGMTRTPLNKNSVGICNPALSRVSNIDVQYVLGGPTNCPVDGFTSYYVGYVKAPYTGDVNFKVSADDGFILNIQGQNIIDNAIDTGPLTYNASGTIKMVANEIYRLEAWHHENASGSTAQLFWDWSGSGGTVIVPSTSLATDPSVFFGTCPLGLTAQCAAGSAMEIKRATNTNMDGQYWIMVNGTPTLTYCIMNSVMSGGGWMLAMKGKEAASTLDYEDPLWTNTSVLNESYPERWKNADTSRDVDAKYGVFAYAKSNQIMALYPEQSGYAGGAIAAGTTGNTSTAYGFSWIETTTAMRPWAAYSATAANGNPAGWGGNSYNVAISGGPTATPTCVNTATTLTNLFSTASRCAFRQVQYLYSASESPYSAIGNDLFYSQYKIRFFGINYGSSGGNRDRARFGFGWNENEDGQENSSDGTGGIGIDRAGYSSITAGSINNCCADVTRSGGPYGQYGISGSANGSSTNIAYELYVRNSLTGTINGNNLRVTSKRVNSLTAGNGYSVTGSNGSNTFRLSPAREGFNIDSTTGRITVSEQIAVGDYTMNVTSTDTDGVVGIRSTTIQVLSESRETDTALSFNGSQYSVTAGTFGLWGDFTYEAWAKPTSACSQSTGNRAVVATNNFVIFCKNSYWYVAILDNSDAWTERQTSLRVVNGEWVHLAVVRSGTTVSVYGNNSQVTMWNGSAWISTFTQSTVKNGYYAISVGGTGDATQYFTGLVDEVKVWDSARTVTQIWTGAHTQENVSQANLLMYWDFNEGTGSAISRAQRVDNNFNLTPSSSSQWTAIADIASDGPYTVVTVPRTLISVNPGWRAPDSITAVFAMVVGGGGGGGGGYQGGGGGGGGVLHSRISVTPRDVYPIKVGIGGRGAYNPTNGLNGDTSTAFGLSAAGGGSGGTEFAIGVGNQQYAASSGGSGGGGNWGSFFTGGSGISGQGSNGGSSLSLESPTCSPSQYAGAGGGGGTGNGAAPSCTKGGNGGSGKLSFLNANYYGGGGGGSLRGSTTASGRGYSTSGGGGSSAYTSAAMPGTLDGAEIGTPGTGGGGGAGLSATGTTGFGGDGGSGTVIFRYITNLKPTFTAPTNAYLNVGMTETFTTNVAQDSATAQLTRTFRWESSTTGSSGTFSLIKQGTGAANASFAWIPPDTSTTGNQYVYRVIVTDSDTAGLFIVDTSTAVFAVINGALKMVGSSSLSKTVNISKTETFTVSSGTPTYRYTLLPDGPNFWLDTSTVGSPRIRFVDTATVGTYFETLTVTDSVSASISIPLTIKVSPPPSFSANAEQVDSGTVLYLDAGNTSSYAGTGTAWSDISGRANHVSLVQNMGSTAYYLDGSSRTSAKVSNNYTCVAPAFNPSNLGSFDFTDQTQCIYIPTVLPAASASTPVYTLETWVKREGSQAAWKAIACTPYRNDYDQIPICLMWYGTNTLVAGIFNGSTWYVTSTYAVPDQTWVHVAVTYNGSTNLSMYINDIVTPYSNASVSVTWNTAKMNAGLLVGRKWDDTWTYSGSIAMARLYSRMLSQSDIVQNYNATKGRFLNTQNKQSQSGKYGTQFSDTYTVTAGSETITAAWSNSSLTRIKWDTSTARSLVLSSQESLTPGTYYDTITVSDVYGASTRIPLTYTIAKADTLTVWIETPTALNYTGTNAVFPTSVRVTGLVSSDTGTAVSNIKYRPAGTSCATGGVCSVGDIGPGGGVVFITPSTSGGNGKYFEVAPFNWSGSDDLATVSTYCSNGNISLGATNVNIGWGETNTNLAKVACLGGAVAKVNSFNLANNTGYTDWFIPSDNEIIELARMRDTLGLLNLGTNWTVGRLGYWSSTESNATTQYILYSSTRTDGYSSKSDSTNFMVRPVRMFSPCWTVDSCTSLSKNVKPIDAGTYLMTGETLTLSTGSLSNYTALSYASTALTINKVNQAPQISTIFNSAFPDTMTLFMTGGSGNGPLFYSIQSGGTATGCSKDYKKIAAQSVGTCNVQVIRGADRNFNSDTATAYVYFTTFVINQPATTVGGGPNIALSGSTSVTLDPNAAPTISAVTFVPTYCSMGMCTPDHWEISGAGFGAMGNTNTIVKFWRNKVVLWEDIAYTTNYVVSDNLIRIQYVPAGATTGKITVTTANGIAVSPDNWIAP